MTWSSTALKPFFGLGTADATAPSFIFYEGLLQPHTIINDGSQFYLIGGPALHELAQTMGNFYTCTVEGAAICSVGLTPQLNEIKPSNQAQNVVTLYKTRPVSERMRLLQTIRGLYELTDDWDGDGATKPSTAAINNADYFFQNLDDDVSALPKISLAGDGEISLAWQTDKIHLDIGFEGDETYYYYGESSHGKTYREPKRDIRLPLPREIVGLLMK